MPASEFWSAIEGRLGSPLPDEVLDFLRLDGLEQQFLSSDEQQSTRAVDRACDVVRKMRDSGLLPGSDQITVEVSDERWSLIAELSAAIAGDRDRTVRPWEPITVLENLHVMPHPLRLSRVGFTVDNAMSRKGLLKAIGDIWPRLREQGLVRRTRPMGERARELIRFVCLEQEPSQTWRERFEAWNDTHPERPFKTARAFHSAFRRGELQLTGSKRGLAWFYDAGSRVRYMSVTQLIEESERGNPDAAAHMAAGIRVALDSLAPRGSAEASTRSEYSDREPEEDTEAPQPEASDSQRAE